MVRHFRIKFLAGLALGVELEPHELDGDPFAPPAIDSDDIEHARRIRAALPSRPLRLVGYDA